jgi:hypothetical protein
MAIMLSPARLASRKKKASGMCVRVCPHTCVSAYICVCVCAYMNMHVCLCPHICAYMCINIHTYVHFHGKELRGKNHVCARTHTHKRTHKCIAHVHGESFRFRVLGFRDIETHKLYSVTLLLQNKCLLLLANI